MDIRYDAGYALIAFLAGGPLAALALIHCRQRFGYALPDVFAAVLIAPLLGLRLWTRAAELVTWAGGTEVTLFFWTVTADVLLLYVAGWTMMAAWRAYRRAAGAARQMTPGGHIRPGR